MLQRLASRIVGDRQRGSNSVDSPRSDDSGGGNDGVGPSQRPEEAAAELEGVMRESGVRFERVAVDDSGSGSESEHRKKKRRRKERKKERKERQRSETAVVVDYQWRVHRQDGSVAVCNASQVVDHLMSLLWSACSTWAFSDAR